MKTKGKNLKEFKAVAKKFINTIIKHGPKKSEATIVGLYGDLGAGKTTFTQEVAKSLGIKGKVVSPTFVIMKSYKLFIHIDAYRLKNEKELEKLGWKDLISNPKNLIFIEWPENVHKILPKEHICVCLEHVSPYRRGIEIHHKNIVK